MQFKLATVLAFVAAASASPALVKKAALDVWSPRIISPDATTVWTVGSTVNVTWDTSDAPENISNRPSVTLNKARLIGSAGILAPLDSFDLRAGFVEVTVPIVPAGNDYSITLFGDSGNTSPDFSIVPA
ncbi:hypothetical protein Moror_9994 [Moniliophthora roreri MCA 2997]|uniref:Ser-Thr-rich glycosyl-phosphatidyl-inositol-anchored membrane family-domain-containing protein n=2 Tax=Moniliophthora roreri TaxID=221103 RepID=V2WYN8_MONRO|nr:hypothetical protein Moror_9994 [Moniliophthora roreri MCA 2997]KAI3615311.1 hypothetical protein WG66_003539 [Moniliophthora roreri]